ncbi:hypothetical protein [Salinisphaera sp. G21_0]|uniref:hypothetical protein n=1 Tax=Salinisphaera sp. G21_0 TaxID=2821094 RepID=UPI001ADAD975|nr:hypothetical protein [Salinisphaera sp. G21_0]MBO9484651.1 hypothetical protein [Salinisphaera sp. G21_0]
MEKDQPLPDLGSFAQVYDGGDTLPCQFSNIFVYAYRPVISVLGIQKKHAFLLIFAISQFFPGMAHAETKEKGQLVQLAIDDTLMLFKSLVSENMNNSYFFVGKFLKISSEAVRNPIKASNESFSLKKADVEQVNKKSEHDSSKGFTYWMASNIGEFVFDHFYLFVVIVCWWIMWPDDEDEKKNAE